MHETFKINTKQIIELELATAYAMQKFPVQTPLPAYNLMPTFKRL